MISQLNGQLSQPWNAFKRYVWRKHKCFYWFNFK